MSATMDPLRSPDFLGASRLTIAPGSTRSRSNPGASGAPTGLGSGSRGRPAGPGGRLASAAGNTLVFLPGSASIRRAEALMACVDGNAHPAQLRSPAQTRIAAETDGPAQADPGDQHRRDLADIDGVRTGRQRAGARAAQGTRAWGSDRLELRSISRASADQRAGRAGSTAPAAACACGRAPKTRRWPRPICPKSNASTWPRPSCRCLPTARGPTASAGSSRRGPTPWRRRRRCWRCSARSTPVAA